jgi:hypothetical protein
LLLVALAAAAGPTATVSGSAAPDAPRQPLALTGGCDPVWEGNVGLTTMPCWVDLSSPSAETVVVGYATGGGTAVAGVDYLPAQGTLTFEPGTTHATAGVSIIGDDRPEGAESLSVRVSTLSLEAQTGQIVGYIVNDDPPPVGADLSHGFVYRGDLTSLDRDRRVEFFRAGLHHPASYEVLVDEVSGDVLPLMLEIPGDARPKQGEPVGAGPAHSLRFDTSPYGVPAALAVAVYSGGCASDCGPDDRYRLRFYETTLSGARIDNVGATRTVLILQNSGVSGISGRIHFWTEDGGYAAMRTFALAPHGSLALDTTEPMPGLSGSVTVTHDAPYGVLQGTATSFDSTTGFDSDSYLQPKLR